MNNRFFLSISPSISSLVVLDSENLNKAIMTIQVPLMLTEANHPAEIIMKPIDFIQRDQFLLKKSNPKMLEHYLDIFDFKSLTFTHIRVPNDLMNKLFHFNPKYKVYVLYEKERRQNYPRDYIHLKFPNGKIVEIDGNPIHQIKLVNDDFAIYQESNMNFKLVIWKTGELISLPDFKEPPIFINQNYVFFLTKNSNNKYELFKVEMRNDKVFQTKIRTFDQFIKKTDSENNDRILVQVSDIDKDLYRIIDFNKDLISEEFKIENAPVDFMYNNDQLFLSNNSYIVHQENDSLFFYPIGNKRVSNEVTKIHLSKGAKIIKLNTETLQLIEIFEDRVQLTHLISKDVLIISLPFKFESFNASRLSDNQKILSLKGRTVNNLWESVLLRLSM